VEAPHCRLLTGITLSSEALAVVPKSSPNGFDLHFVRITVTAADRRRACANFFRAKHLRPMGTRAVSLYLRQASQAAEISMRSGSTTPGGTTAYRVFEQEALKSKKEFIGKVFARTGTKINSPYITKIRQSGAGCRLLVLQRRRQTTHSCPGAATTAFPERLSLADEIVDLARSAPWQMRSLALIGSSRYSFTYDIRRTSEFVLWLERKAVRRRPDTSEGEQWQSHEGVRGRPSPSAGGIEAAKLRTALEDIEIESRAKARCISASAITKACSRAFMVEVVQGSRVSTRPVAEVIATFPRRKHDADLQHHDLPKTRAGGSPSVLLQTDARPPARCASR